MDDTTAIAKVLEDEGDEEAISLLGEPKDNGSADTPAAVLKQIKFIGTKITEVSLTLKQFSYISMCYLGSQLFPRIRVPLLGHLRCSVRTHPWVHCRSTRNECR